jgi:hypothetical protein
MNIFYGKSDGRPDVSRDVPVAATLETALAVFRGLDVRKGFLGIILDHRFVIQLVPYKKGGTRVELLDTSIPAFDMTVTSVEFAESLIRAAADGQDVFKIAKASDYQWEHVKLKYTPEEIAAAIEVLPPPKPRSSPVSDGPTPPPVTYPLVSVKSGKSQMAGIWVSIGFSSEQREFDVLHVVGGDSTNPQHIRLGLVGIYLERYDQSLSCYQGADAILIKDDALTITLNKTGQDALHLPGVLHFTTNAVNNDFKAARAIFTKMKQYESGKIIRFA